MTDPIERSYSFTLRGQHTVFDTAQTEAFLDQDAETILRTLQEQLCVVPFSDYLKRYVYLKAGLFGSYQQVPLKEYQTIIQDAFQETGTPSSLRRNTTRLSGLIRNWLTQSSVRRNVVQLLGFGLSMPVEDVNDFMTKALHDHRLDEDDPLEAICLYCYEHQYRFPKMEQLWRIYEQSEPGRLDVSLVRANQPAGRAESRTVIEEDTELLRRLLNRKGLEKETAFSEKTQFYFQRLYQQVGEYIRASERDPLIPVSWKGPVAPHEIEELFCASIPRSAHGNLVPEINSSLRDVLAGKRLSRQRLFDLLHRNAEPSRYDLITLCFFLHSVRVDQQPDAKKRYLLFEAEISHILDECGFGPLYLADPYECFIVMCLLSVDPLGTYGDVLELSYDGAPDPSNEKND